MKNKYYNDAVVGNENVVASFNKRGEMLRFYYSSPDYKQFVDMMYTGVKVNDSNIIYLSEDINNIYDQYFTPNTNIINTIVKNTYFNLTILQTDFVPLDKDMLIKKYVLKNENNIDLNVNFLVYSKLLSNFNNMISSKIDSNVCMQYSHDYTYCIFSKNEIIGYRLNNSFEEINSGVLHDKDFTGMAEDVGISFDVGLIRPGEEKEIDIFIYINNNEKKSNFDEILEDVEALRKIDVDKELTNTAKYWEKYVKAHDTLKVLNDEEKWQMKLTGKQKEELNEYTYEKYLEMKNIYTRTILLYPLLLNEETGGISAGIEVDENREKSGRYSYCWTRDAVFICKALDILGMKDEVTKFYTNFCKKTQSKNGMWQQRFYTDGRLAPCWGYQIDETASIIYGVYEHYKVIKNKEFLKETYEMCKKAIEVLGTFLFSVSVPVGLLNKSNIQDFEKNVKFFNQYEGYDLWEMNEGVHLYSFASIFAAYEAMANIEKELNNNEEKQNELKICAEKLREYVLFYFVNKEDSTLKRNNKDNICDISVLSAVIPFNMLSIDDIKIRNTIERINFCLKTYTGGYLRFENDSYLGGINPWPVSTLWMALYNLKKNNMVEALRQINYISKTATKQGMLGEQIDNEAMTARWVLGLGWSHAMYIIALDSLMNKE